MSAAADSMKERLRADLSGSMRARNAIETEVIRSLLAALDNAEALPLDQERRASLQARFGDGSAEAGRHSLSSEDVAAVIDAEIRHRADSAADLERLGQGDRAEILRRQAQIAERYIG